MMNTPLRNLSLLACLAASASTALAAATLSFNEADLNYSASNVATITIDTDGALAPSAGEDSPIDTSLGLSGSTTQNVSFDLVMTAGFNWDLSSGNETWDATRYGTSETDNQFRFSKGSTGGIAPRGDSSSFSDQEILWFEVANLAADHQLILEGFTMANSIGSENGFLNFYQNGARPVLGESIANDGALTALATPLILINGNKFGVAWRSASTAQRSYLQSIQFDVIPEPSTYAMIAGLFALTSVMIRRRR